MENDHVQYFHDQILYFEKLWKSLSNCVTAKGFQSFYFLFFFLNKTSALQSWFFIACQLIELFLSYIIVII